ncbi:hypothetical protein [Anabaena sp. UHCC 0451]|uniref:hypothetical protein n=1 Tax=Anabaena sp. UHCC 0451 TaxID=2055235 RepID=UPI002B21A6D9|nr:hypothetical protein [Anabaena sp. UHCC 0451]MEA5578646.1 hypothetical protein [Anabaena sp. UHCC 0451]
MEFHEILAELKKPFKPTQHQERPLPGGGRWFYITWQDIRERLDEVYPEWSCTWTEPVFIGDYCFISCTISIAGVSRQAPGNAPIQLLSSNGKDMSRGTPIERATADAFKNAAEAFGVARYLDDQRLTASLMHKQGDYRASKFARENEEIALGARGSPIKKSKSKPISDIFSPESPREPDVITPNQVNFSSESPKEPDVITLDQVKRLWTIARKEYQLSDDDVRQVLAKFQLESTRAIPSTLYDAVMRELGNVSPVNF